MVILHLLLVLYVIFYGKRYSATKYILGLFYIIWFICAYVDIAEPGGMGPHNAELLLLIIATICYWLERRKIQKNKTR